MTISATEWFDLAVAQSGKAQPLAPVLPPCGQLLDPKIPSDEREALENAIWQSLDAQFPWFMAVGQNSPAYAAKISELARVIRWLETSIASWSGDPTSLAELLYSIAWLNNRNELIESLPATFVCNPDLLRALGDIIHDAPPPVHLFWPGSANAVPSPERLEAAWQQGIWSEVARYFDATQYFLPTTSITTCVRILARWSPAILRALGDEAQDLVTAQAISSALERRDALQLAALTTSQVMRFTCAYSKLHASRTALTLEETAILSGAFVAASGDTRMWRGWMEIFNRYPVRFPQIQASLGAALSRMPAKSLFIYIDSLELHTRPDNERALVGECLSNFASRAGKRKRTTFWKHAHRRWHSWDFGRGSSDNVILDISWSALDHALTGFFLECLSENERSTITDKLRSKLEAVDSTWHDSLTACATEWYRIQSQLQPVLHASTVADTGCDWLAQKLYVASPIADHGLYFDRKHLRMARH